MPSSHVSVWTMSAWLRLSCCLFALLLIAARGLTDDGYRQKAGEPMVEVARACPGVLIHLRYATPQNLTGAPIYPPKARALLRQSVAERLRHAHSLLSKQGFGLQVWDAYRPPSAHDKLWDARPNREFVGDPAKGGSLHSWGVAVDVTLVDQTGREVKMPTGFDEFGPAAARRYTGADREVAANLRLLQQAMVAAGFLAMRDEWWHFVAKDFRDFGPVTPPVTLLPVEP